MTDPTPKKYTKKILLLVGGSQDKVSALDYNLVKGSFIFTNYFVQNRLR